MKVLILIVGVVFLIVAALATPVAAGLGIYDWVIAGSEFKFALWYGCKVWLVMITTGVTVGLPCYLIGMGK